MTRGNHASYTDTLQDQLEDISWEDENFIEELLQVVRLFRPFSEAMDEFLVEHGFAGDVADTEGKVGFIRETFAKANMEAPREIREWFAGQPLKRDTVFQICFAFGLDGSETDEFFRRIYTRKKLQLSSGAGSHLLFLSEQWADMGQCVGYTKLGSSGWERRW